MVSYREVRNMSAQKKAKIIVVPHYEGADDFSVLIRRVITEEIRKKQEATE